MSGAPSYGGYGGYASPPPRGPPAGADPQLWQWFTAVDTDRSGAISVTELQAALINGEHDPPAISSDIASEAHKLLNRKLDE